MSGLLWRLRARVERRESLRLMARGVAAGLRELSRAARRGRRSRMIDRYLATHPIAKLQIGAGATGAAGWLNSDLSARDEGDAIFLDVTCPFPFPDCAFDYVVAEHLIEHVGYREAGEMLAECFRVLKPGGRVRLATPDLRVLLALFSPEKDPRQRRFLEWIAAHDYPDLGSSDEVFALNNAFRNYGHQFLYDEPTLRRSLEKAGFSGVTRHRPGESTEEHLRNLEKHGVAIGDEEINQFETMVLEGTR